MDLVAQEDNLESQNAFIQYYQRKTQTLPTNKSPQKIKPVEKYIDELKFHLNGLMNERLEQFTKYITQISNGNQFNLIVYLKKIYKDNIVSYLPPNIYQHSISDLVIIARHQVKNIEQNLTESEREQYQQFTKDNIKRRQNQSIKYPQHLFSLQGMVKLDILLLFFLKNYKYQNDYNYHAISQSSIIQIFDIGVEDYKRFKGVFEDSMNILESRHINQFEMVFKLFTIIQFKHRIGVLQKHRFKQQFHFVDDNCSTKSPPNIADKDQKNDKTRIRYNFCEIAMQTRGRKFFNDASFEKRSLIIKEIQNIVINHKQSKRQLLNIREKYRIRLTCLVELYELISKNPELKIKLNKNLEEKINKQLEIYKWIFLNRAITLNNESKNSFFYLQEYNQVKYRPQTLMIAKIAFQRYRIFAKVNRELLKVIYFFPQPPLLHICRFEYSYNEIKTTSYENGRKQKKMTQDLRFTQIIGFSQGKIVFQAVTHSALDGYSFGKFILEYFKVYLKDKKYNILLYEFLHNDPGFWQPLKITIYDMKSKFDSLVFLANSPQFFKSHLSIYTCIRRLLKNNAKIITRQSFFKIFYQIKQAVITALTNSKSFIEEKYQQQTEKANKSL